MGRGPGVRVLGEEAIQIDFRWKGRRIRERVRLAPTKANLAYCRGWKRRIEEEIAHGTFDYAKHFPEGRHANIGHPSGKLSAFLRAYVASLAGQIQPETAREYGNDCETLARALGDPPVRSLTRAMLREWVSKQKLSKRRIDSILRPVRGALKQGIEDEVITENPLEGFEVRRIQASEDETIDPFTPGEVASLHGVQNGELWRFWAWTGLRSGEIIGLRWGDVGRECSNVTIRRAVRLGREKSPKTASGVRVVQLLQPARDAISSLRRGEADSPVFINPNTGEDWHEAKALNRAFARACKEAGVRRRYVYQLRHTFATWALSSGENPAWIASQMGHTDTSMLFRHYGKWMPQMDPLAGSRMLEAAKPKARRGHKAA
jgi:integrase